MQSIKVVFSVSKNRIENKIKTGYGFISKDNVLFLHFYKKDGSDKWIGWSEWNKHVFPTVLKEGEYTGWYTQYENVFVPTKHDNFAEVEVEVNYHIWLKKIPARR